MQSIITDELVTSNAISFRNSFLYSPTYMCLGRTIAWENDLEPPNAVYSSELVNDIWQNMNRGRKIFGTDSTLLIDNHTWLNGEIYDRYSNNYDIKELSFYVITDENCIYKVIDNNNFAQSAIKPTGTSLNIIETSDGYKWKFMYQLTTDQVNRFLTNDYIPILETTNVTSRGEIYCYDIINSEDFLTAPVLTVVGDGFGAEIVAIVENDKIVNVDVINYGFGYTNAKVLIDGVESINTTILPILTPINGHGYNIAQELFATKVGIFCQFTPEIGNNETIRQVTCIRNPTINNLQFNGETIRQTTILNMSGIITAIVGQTIESATGSGIITRTLINSLEINNINGYFVIGQLITINGVPISSVNIESIDNPSCDKNSGELLYISNMQPYTRDDSQVENHILVISM